MRNLQNSYQQKTTEVTFIEEKVEKDGKIKAYHFLDPDCLELEVYGKTGGLSLPLFNGFGGGLLFPQT